MADKEGNKTGGRAKGTRDIAPEIRGAFIRAIYSLHEKGKPLSSLIEKKLEEDPLNTLTCMAKFLPVEKKVSGTVKHEHNHTHEMIDQTKDWINQIIGKNEETQRLQ